MRNGVHDRHAFGHGHLVLHVDATPAYPEAWSVLAELDPVAHLYADGETIALELTSHDGRACRIPLPPESVAALHELRSAYSGRDEDATE